MAISLSNITRTKHEYPPRVVIHGAEKVGKSTFFAGGSVALPNGSRVDLKAAPNPIFIRTEDGLTGLDVDAFPLAESYAEVMESIQALAEQEHDYRTVVIDSADWLERLIWQKVCEDWKVESLDKVDGGYGKGYSYVMPFWREFLAAMDYLNKAKGMLIGIICHSSIAAFAGPDAEPFDRYELKLHSPKRGTGARDLLTEWADVIGFAHRKVVSTGVKQTVDGKKYVGRTASVGLNRLQLVGSAGVVAGNRFNLPKEIALDWGAFESEIAETSGGGQDED